jgi:hypothetical protein
LRRAIGGAVVLGALVAAGLVYAAWTAGGQGSGYVRAGTAVALSTVDASAQTTATLYPGGSGDVVLKVHNPNPYPVRITDVALRGANSDIAPDGAHAGCDPTGVSFSDRTGLSIDVDPSSDRQTTLTGAAEMSNASADACQGATFAIPLTLSGQSNAG